MSDYYGIVTIILNVGPVPMTQHIPRWKMDRSNWKAYKVTQAQCVRCSDSSLTDNVDVLEAIDKEASQTMNKGRKHFCGKRTPENLGLLRGYNRKRC